MRPARVGPYRRRSDILDGNSGRDERFRKSWRDHDSLRRCDPTSYRGRCRQALCRPHLWTRRGLLTRNDLDRRQRPYSNPGFFDREMTTDVMTDEQLNWPVTISRNDLYTQSG
jgi:hypothetical protein